MKEKSAASSPSQPMLNGKRHSVAVQYTNKDAQERLYEFLKKQGPDVNKHELAVDFYAENPEFSEGFRVYSVIHVLEDILQHMLNRSRPEPSTQLILPGLVQELGGLPQYIPYLSDTGQTRNILACEAGWFHLDSWRDIENRAYGRRSSRNKRVNRIVRFFEPYMKGTKLKLRNVCDTLNTTQKPN